MPHTRNRIAATIVAIAVLAAIAAPSASADSAGLGFQMPAAAFVPFGLFPFGGDGLLQFGGNVAVAAGPCARSTAQGQGGTGVGQGQVCDVDPFVGP